MIGRQITIQMMIGTLMKSSKKRLILVKTQQSQDSQTYERQQEPKSSSQSGSVYSYSYREPKNTAVGKTESVYDADYRVIIPPYQPPTTDQADNAMMMIGNFLMMTILRMKISALVREA